LRCAVLHLRSSLEEADCDRNLIGCEAVHTAATRNRNTVTAMVKFTSN